MKNKNIDSGNSFDFGKTSADYALFRDIYPQSMYDKLTELGIGRSGQKILDLGSGTAVLPIRLCRTGALFTATDISENQIKLGKQRAAEISCENISFKVCSAENTGFNDESFDAVTAVQCFQYFNAEIAAAEIRRVLKPGGLFCKIFMDWLPYEDEKIAETERLVLKYNPNWSGGGFKEFNYSFPHWAQGRFTLESVQSYKEELCFTKDAWIGRIRTCRGVGASLSPAQIRAFETEYTAALAKYPEPLRLKHEIHIELYKRV
ncbi:MAG TPA: class I SAM-dependent methyltransferase [Ruminococcaceae bacterium]|nr:class I SAM-dependent methyltransferase [Oscillospiraceae bacterium]